MIALPGKLLTNSPSIQDFQAMVGHQEDEGKEAAIQQHENDNNTKMKDSMETESVTKTSLKIAKHDTHSTSNDNMVVENSKMSMSNNNDNFSQTIHTMMMKDSMQPSTIELVLGGLYHFWNGATMAAVYTLIVGKGRWYYGLIWGFIINIGMMFAPWMIPMVGPFGINYGLGYTIFIASLVAHLSYGAVIGILAQRFIKEKKSLLNIISS